MDEIGGRASLDFLQATISQADEEGAVHEQNLVPVDEHDPIRHLFNDGSEIFIRLSQGLLGFFTEADVLEDDHVGRHALVDDGDGFPLDVNPFAVLPPDLQLHDRVIKSLLGGNIPDAVLDYFMELAEYQG